MRCAWRLRRIVRAVCGWFDDEIDWQLDMDLNPLNLFRRRSVPVRERRAFGGLYNPLTGAGTAIDRNVANAILPTMLDDPERIDVYCDESWFLKALVNIPVDDMFVLWRAFEGSSADAMRAAEVRYRVKSRLSMALKAGRKYGTGLLLMLTRDADLDTPLDPARVRVDDLRSLQVANRFDVVHVMYDADIDSLDYGRPMVYRVRLGDMSQLDVHASRVLRFDGVSSTRGGHLSPGREWGRSVLAPALQAAGQDMAIASVIGHLVQEASTTTLKVHDLNERVADHGYDSSPDARPSVKEQVEQASRARSVFGMHVIDADDDIERVEVGWGGIDRVIEANHKRLTAISGLPGTRLYGQSPVGMNATGESDLVNYAMSVRAMQHNQLSEPLSRLDAVVARSSGLTEAPPYEFLPLTETSEGDRALTAGAVASAVSTAVQNFLIDEDEGRAVLAESGFFGDIDGSAPEPRDVAPRASSSSSGDGDA